MINLSDSTPAVPAGPDLNVKWQQDGTGNVSAYYKTTPVKVSVTSTAGVLTIDASLGNSFLISVNEAITSMSITNPTDGQEITLVFVQDGSGHAVTFATNMRGTAAVSTTALTASVQKFTYDTGTTMWYAIPGNAMSIV